MKLTINNDAATIDQVLRYGASLVVSDHLIFHSVSRLPNIDAKYTFKLGIGHTKLCYQEILMNINYSVTEQIVGTAAYAVKYRTLELTTKHQESEDFFSEFLESAYQFCKLKKEKSEVVTYIFKTGYWQQLSKLPKREVETLHLPNDLLKENINDLEKFLNGRDEYIKYGIPYKRNYLFEGIPGTGKTSFIFVLASYFDMNIAIINFGLSIDDATFMKSISKLPEDCFLVLEDIDALFVERKPGDSHKSMVSFSGILNTLDGLARRDRQVTFLTTNYISKLDAALVRPGRIDKVITFSYATTGQIEKFYKKFLPDKKNTWNLFKKKLGNLKTTAAILQSFFFQI